MNIHANKILSMVTYDSVRQPVGQRKVAWSAMKMFFRGVLSVFLLFLAQTFNLYQLIVAPT